MTMLALPLARRPWSCGSCPSECPSRGTRSPVLDSNYVFDLGGAKRARTADLLHAMQALYQLSYSPGIAHVTGTRTGVSIPVPWTLSNNLDTDPRDATQPAPQAPHHPRTSAVVAEHRLRQRSRVVLDQPPAPMPAGHDRPGAVSQRPNGAPQVLGEAKQPGGP